MRILYVIPGTMSKTELGEEELGRRKKILQKNAGKDTVVDITDIEEGPSSIESSYEEYLSIPATVERVVQSEKEGYDGVILGCFGDPGLDDMRETVKIPVIGPGETSMVTAAILGHRFSIITVMDSVIPSLEKLAKVVGVERKLASVRSVNIPVLELGKDMEVTKKKIIEEAEIALEHDRSDVIILGCMSMAFMGISEEIQEKLGIPVVNPAYVSLKILEALISSHLSPSKRAFPYPPKLGK